MQHDIIVLKIQRAKQTRDPRQNMSISWIATWTLVWSSPASDLEETHNGHVDGPQQEQHVCFAERPSGQIDGTGRHWHTSRTHLNPAPSTINQTDRKGHLWVLPERRHPRFARFHLFFSFQKFMFWALYGTPKICGEQLRQAMVYKRAWRRQCRGQAASASGVKNHTGHQHSTRNFPGVRWTSFKWRRVSIRQFQL